jgi:outer membrane protein
MLLAQGDDAMKVTWNDSMKLLMAMTLMGFALGLADPTAADEKPALGLDQLMEMALENSPELQEAEQSVAVAKADLSQAKAGQWAQMDVIGMVGPTWDAKTPYVAVGTNAVNGVYTGSIVDRDENSIGVFGRLDLIVTQPLFTFGKISHRQDAAAYGVDVKRSARDKKRGDVILKVKEYYFGLVVAQQGLKAADDTDAFIQDAHKRIQRLLDLRSTNVQEADLYRLAAFEADVKQFKAKAESGARVAYLALKQTVGYPANQDFRLDARELPKDTRALGNQEEYIQTALARRPELEQLQKGIAAQRSMVEAAKADLYPSFFAAGIGSFAGAPGREHFDNTYFRDEFNHVEGGVVLGAQWHFDLGIGQAKVSKAKAEHQKLVHTKDYAERNIPVEVTKYYQDAMQAETSFKAYEKAAVGARKWIVTAFTNFDMGVGTARDMFDAIDRYGKNQGEYLVNLYNYHVALANLSHAVAEYRLGNP